MWCADVTGDKPHTCQLCGKKFALQCNLKTHMKTHEGQCVEMLPNAVISNTPYYDIKCNRRSHSVSTPVVRMSNINVCSTHGPTATLLVHLFHTLTMFYTWTKSLSIYSTLLNHVPHLNRLQPSLSVYSTLEPCSTLEPTATILVPLFHTFEPCSTYGPTATILVRLFHTWTIFYIWTNCNNTCPFIPHLIHVPHMNHL